MTGRRLRTAVIGGGLIAQAAHLPNLRRLDDHYELVALADPSARVREAAERRFGPLAAYADWRQLLAHEPLDAVVVRSPAAMHRPQVLAALELGLHVLVEKPLCIAVADADRIAERARAAGRVVLVGYMKRYDPVVEHALAAIERDAELRFAAPDLRPVDGARAVLPARRARGRGRPRRRGRVGAARRGGRPGAERDRHGQSRRHEHVHVRPTSSASSTTSTCCTACSTARSRRRGAGPRRRAVGRRAAATLRPRCPAAERRR